LLIEVQARPAHNIRNVVGQDILKAPYSPTLEDKDKQAQLTRNSLKNTEFSLPI
jgi:hypothetical protein